MSLKKINLGGSAQKSAVIMAWIAMFIFFAILMPDTFFTWNNIRTMLASQAVLVMCALAILVPIIGGAYDMSVAANVTFVNILIAKLNVDLGVPLMPCVIIGVLAGVGIGALNGVIVTKFNISPFIVTMGMQTLIAGLALMVSQASITGMGQMIKDLVYAKKIFSIAPSFYYAIILCAILAYVFAKTAGGKRLLIVGQSEQTARLSGINVERIRFFSFVLSGLISGCAGVVYTGVTGSGNPTAGLSYLLPAFAAVFLGSTILSPGRFNAVGTVIAVYFLTTGTNGLALLGVQSYIQNIFYGAALIVAVIFAAVTKKSKEKKEESEAKALREKQLESQTELYDNAKVVV
ncbi:ABC transporter permease [Eubacterium oxidoreducens]|uniref:Ribose transport system permease protein n=1 Tax=Eubacterium oxidoreducens TaxID=1732 RepID=A0A1G6C7E3_EUBOX|nr:ABC transporter permease [Eubacterium oxidoreducens]SDB28751.1 ribose transport system permease protein [Eubacterium oxidoreducens]